MKKQYQVTLICATGQYRPVSTIVTIEQESNDNLLLDLNKKQEIIQKGVVRICQQRYWTDRDRRKYVYTRVKARVYEKQEK